MFMTLCPLHLSHNWAVENHVAMVTAAKINNMRMHVAWLTTVASKAMRAFCDTLTIAIHVSVIVFLWINTVVLWLALCTLQLLACF